MTRYLLVLSAGFLAQYIDGTLGMGFGVSSASFLLAAGLAPAAVSASVHAAKIAASLASGVSHLKLGNVDMKICVPLTCAGVAGGVLGACCLCSVDGRLLRPYLALLLLVLGVKILITHLRKRAPARPGRPLSAKFLVPLGIVGGVVDAIGGGGWGPICTPALISTNKSEPRLVVGSVNAAEFLTALATTITFAFTLGLDRFLWGIALPLMAGGVVAAPLSALACKRIAPGSLGVAVGAVLIVLNLRILAPAATGLFGIALPALFDSIVVLAVASALVLVLVRSFTARQRAVSEETP